MKRLNFFVLGVLCLPLYLQGQNRESIQSIVDPVSIQLYGLPLDDSAKEIKCRTLPFLAASPTNRGQSKRVESAPNTELIPVGTKAKTLFLLGMINQGWDFGVAHWNEHPELQEKRSDQIQIGSQLGTIEIMYSDKTVDAIPVVVGSNAWFAGGFKNGWTHGRKQVIQEPFASRSEYKKIFEETLLLKEHPGYIPHELDYTSYYLAIEPRQQLIDSIKITSNSDIRGRVMVSAITLEGASPTKGLVKFGKQKVERSDLKPALQSKEIPDLVNRTQSLAGILYTSEEDLPDEVEAVEFPEGSDLAKITYLGEGPWANMLSNIWVSNLMNINQKFEKESGLFYETCRDCPWYGGYQGIGTWDTVGVYREAYSRTADHYVRQALRCAYDPQRTTSFVDYVDQWLYIYRNDHNPENGPANAELDTTHYPADAPPHWSFVTGRVGSAPFQINEIWGAEEMDGHASVIVARWFAWKLLGKPQGDWLFTDRQEVFTKNRWESSKDAADFICWYLDYTGMDVVFSEGEFTGWAGMWLPVPMVPEGMYEETDPVKIRENYANSDMYEVYPSYSCMIALMCSADMAESIGEKELAEQYRSYADRIRGGMLRLLAIGSDHERMWRVCRHSVLPSLQDCLAQLWFGLYSEGLDPMKYDPDLLKISKNTLKRQINQLPGLKPVLAMGYGIGWLTHSALILDDLDHAGKLLENIARYTYDKNMDYVDEARGIDWRKWLWIIPEGTNIMPDGRWYRIGDLSNGANQGPAMNALEMCAGVDDKDSDRLRLLPRVPNPLNGLEVENMVFMTEEEGAPVIARLNYTYLPGISFELNASRPIPNLDIRFGPFISSQEAKTMASQLSAELPGTIRVEQSGSYREREAWWVWAENLQEINKLDLNF